MARIIFFVAVALGFLVSAQAMPLPPAQRAAKAPSAKEPIQVKVRRIEQLQAISTTAPPPRGALQGDHPLLVVMVETQDSRFSEPDVKRRLRGHFFAPDGPSLSHFYRENSYGLYRIVGEVLGPVTAGGDLLEYSYRQASGHGRVHKLIEEAFRRVAAKIDMKVFDRFDQFGRPKPDGIVDHFAVVFPAQDRGHAGFFAPIWPHRGTIDVRHGKRRLKSYFVFADTLPLGAAAHEYGHDIGLPDLYDRDDSSHGDGVWCTMAAGSWLGRGKLPAHISAWGKVRMGWVRPQIIARSQKRVEIPAVESMPVVLKVPIGRADADEYFLVENRQRVGYDAKLPNDGLLIWHIDESVKSNDDENRKLVDVEEPSRTQDLDIMYRDQDPDHVDTFRAGRRSRFADDTDPNARTNAGKPTRIVIDNISPSKGVMVADFTVPTIAIPDGEPYKLIQDGYNFGAFGYVPLPKGAEELIRFEATQGGYEINELEALVVANPHSRGELTVRVYGHRRGKPGKPLITKKVEARFGADTYQWLKIRLDPEKVRLGSKEKFWVGVQHGVGQVGLAYNPDSVSQKSLFRFNPRRPLESAFPLKGGKQPVPDYIIRVSGYGFIGVRSPELPEQADENDELIKRMREADRMLDRSAFLEAQAQYETILPKMEEKPDRFSTWIPVVHNALGVAAYQAKNYGVAIHYFERSLKRAQLAGDEQAEADILENLGETHFFAGHLQEAAGYCKRSEALNGDRPNRLMENKYWQGRIAYQRGDMAAAGRYLDHVLPLVMEVFERDESMQKKWAARIERARRGVAVGEDWSDGTSRMAQELTDERALEQAPDAEETSNQGRAIDLADFGLGGGTFEIHDE